MSRVICHQECIYMQFVQLCIELSVQFISHCVNFLKYIKIDSPIQAAMCLFRGVRSLSIYFRISSICFSSSAVKGAALTA